MTKPTSEGLSTLDWRPGRAALARAASAVGWNAGEIDPRTCPTARDFVRRRADALQDAAIDAVGEDRGARYAAACVALSLAASEVGFTPSPAHAAVAETALDEARSRLVDGELPEVAAFRKSLLSDDVPAPVSRASVQMLTDLLPHLAGSLDLMAALVPGAADRLRTDSLALWEWDDASRAAASALRHARPAAWKSPFGGEAQARALAVGEALAASGVWPRESFARACKTCAGLDPHPRAGSQDRECALSIALSPADAEPERIFA